MKAQGKNNRDRLEKIYEVTSLTKMKVSKSYLSIHIEICCGVIVVHVAR